jgi:hypothetical protein
MCFIVRQKEAKVWRKCFSQNKGSDFLHALELMEALGKGKRKSELRGRELCAVVQRADCGL